METERKAELIYSMKKELEEIKEGSKRTYTWIG